MSTGCFVVEILSGAYKALHINVRFNHKGVLRQVVCSAELADGWGAEVRQGGFPFKYDELFKFTVTLTREEFLVLLSDGSEIHFQNSLGASEYKSFSFWGVWWPLLTADRFTGR
uniref:Galectin n=1 Tax=Gadus morhua TaxID=8049 RepID=A0A8C5CEY9_GADMO